MLFSTMVYSKPAYRPTSPHSSNQQIHAYKNSNVNKICIADITSLAQWRFKDCSIHHFHIAHVHLPSCLAPPPPPLSPVKLETTRRSEQGVLQE